MSSQIEQKVVDVVTGIATVFEAARLINDSIQALNAGGWTVNQCVPSAYRPYGQYEGAPSATSFLLLCTKEGQPPEEGLSEEELAETFVFLAANAG